MIAQHQTDRLLGTDDWLARFAEISRDGPAAAAMRSMLDSGVPNPADAIEAIFTQTGVPYVRRNGTIVLAPTAI